MKLPVASSGEITPKELIKIFALSCVFMVCSFTPALSASLGIQ